MDKGTTVMLEMIDIDLSYSKLPVLKKLNFSLNKYEIHALLGEHGAGKSSLARIISGLQKPQNGLIKYRNNKYNELTVKEAHSLGIKIASQHIQLYDRFSIANNIMIGKYPSPFKLYNKKKELDKIISFFEKYEIDLQPESTIRSLNLSERMMVEFLKSIYTTPKILILDETLEHLSNKYLQKVIPILRDLKNKGTAILFITHRIDDIYELADRVSIIRDGKIIITEDIKSIDKLNLIKIAYTQVIKEHSIKHLDFNFYKLLRYNEAILTNLPFSIVVIDTKNEVKIINQAAKRFFNIQDSSYTDVKLTELFGEKNAQLAGVIEESIKQRKQEIFYNTQMERQNIDVFQNISIIPLFDGQQYIGSIITMEDMTEYQEMQKQLTISENLSSIGLLATGVAHEINNPLEIINYYIQNLKLTYPIDTNIQEVTGQIGEEIYSISKIIENLLLFSDSKEIENETFELNSLLSILIKIIGKISDEKNIQIYFQPDNNPVYINAEKTEIKQVFLNIIKNSFEALSDNGIIKIETEIIKNEEVPSVVRISIMDNGPGVDQKIINNLYSPFFTTKHEYPLNMGLGLSISYKIITKYCGTMKMENNDDGGCRTILTLPLCPVKSK